MARYRRFDTTRAGVTIVDTAEVPDVIEGVRSRRAGLRAAISELEYALAAPAPHRVDEWRRGVRESLTSLHDVWTRHIVETEAPGAFLDELIEEAPRLSTPAARLRREHNEILGVITRSEKTLLQVLLDDDHQRVRRHVARRSHRDAVRARAPPAARRRPHLRGLRRRHRRRLKRVTSLPLMRLSGTGIWSGQLRYGDAGLAAEAAAELDELGYDAIWIPDVGGDVFTPIENLLGATSRLTIATGILNVWMHEPAEVAARRASWTDDWTTRFLLGLGVSHAPLIDHNDPGRYKKPYSKMVEYLDGLDAAEIPWPPDARVLAALGPRMLELAARSSVGRAPLLRHTRARCLRTRDDGARQGDWRGARGRDRQRSVDGAHNGAAPYRGLRRICPTTPTTCADSDSETTTSPTREATGSSTPSSRGEISTRSRRAYRRCATRAPTTCASK